jgi:predicted secreted hydrolase
MPTTGSIQVGTTRTSVQGESWMDREWSTSALGPGQVGWDWFALQLDDGRALMYYRLRLRDGGDDPYNSGLLIAPDGGTRRLAAGDVQLQASGSWRSPATGVTYPSGWRLRVPSASIDLTITPILQDQELRLTTVYWEGAVDVVDVAGAAAGGRGYVELTGYDEGQHEFVRGR